MTLVSQIIIDAFRQSNLLALTASPTASQASEALRYLNRIVKSTIGNEAGDNLSSFPIGKNTYNRPAGYPWWDEEPDGQWFVPADTRLMVNTVRPFTVYLNPDPDDGCRLAVTAASTNLVTNPLTINGNGRLVDGQANLVLTSNAEFFYRADTASWMRYTPLTSSDTFPFPEEFDDYFITMLAMRLNPSYGASLAPESQEVFRRSKTQLRARYTQTEPQRSELGLLRLSKMAADRDQWGSIYNIYNAAAMFNKGWPY